MNTFTRRGIYLVLICFVTCVLVVYSKDRFSSLYSKVTFLDVGQGDSILIQTPSNKQLLVDAGRSKNVVELLEKHMPYFDRTIDVVIGTHPDADHIGGLPGVFDNYSIGAFFEPGSTSDSNVYKSLEKKVVDMKVPHVKAYKDMVIDFGDGSYFIFLFPGQDVATWETNNSSIVGVYVYKDTSFLLTGDAPIATEMYLVKNMEGLKADIVKLGHHGSRTSSSESFLKTINPGLAIISAGKGNSYGHPHREVMDRLKKMSIPSMSTVDLGTMEFTSNGYTLSLKHFK